MLSAFAFIIVGRGWEGKAKLNKVGRQKVDRLKSHDSRFSTQDCYSLCQVCLVGTRIAHPTK